jgi:carbon monoxide dehydrogenase subunit G
MVLYSITKSISIDAPPARVFEFLANPVNWPKWAIVNVKSIKPTGNEWWEMETPAGSAKLRIRPNAASGMLDHDFNAPDASWTVPARVVANGTGSEFMITFFQPPSFTKAFYEEQAALVDRELAQLKKVLE